MPDFQVIWLTGVNLDNFGVNAPQLYGKPNQISISVKSHFEFQPILPDEVVKALRNTDTESSTGEDKLDPPFFKLSAPIITGQLTYIFNLSIPTGKFPNVWKSAHVTPLHKGGDRDNLDNYRPISKLPC